MKKTRTLFSLSVCAGMTMSLLLGNAILQSLNQGGGRYNSSNITLNTNKTSLTLHKSLDLNRRQFIKNKNTHDPVQINAGFFNLSHDGSILLSLTIYGMRARQLTVPATVTHIAKDALVGCNATWIKLSHHGYVEIEGKVKREATYVVFDDRIADYLMQVGCVDLNNYKITVLDPNSRYKKIYSGDFEVYSWGWGTDWAHALVGLTPLGKTKDTLTIDPNKLLPYGGRLRIWADDAFREHSPSLKLIELKSTSLIEIDGHIPDVCWEVYNVDEANVLLDGFRLTHPIFVHRGSEIFTEQVKGNFILEIKGKEWSLFGKNVGIVSLSWIGRSQHVIVIPFLIDGTYISKINSDAFKFCSPELKTIIFESSSLVIEKGAFPSSKLSVSKTTPSQYYTAYYAVAEALEKSGISKVVIHHVETDDSLNFWVCKDSDQTGKTVELIGLSYHCQNSNANLLFIPNNITKIAAHAFDGCPASVNKLNIVTQSAINEIGADAFKDARYVNSYFVNFDQTVIAMIKSGINAVQSTIFVHNAVADENAKIMLKNGCCVIKREAETGVTTLIAINGQPLTGNLLVPAEVSVIGNDVLKVVHANKIILLHPGKIAINGGVADIEYDVQSFYTGIDLINRNVSKPITVHIDRESFSLQVKDNFILKTDAQRIISLVGLTTNGKKLDHLVIPENVECITVNAFDGAKANLIDFSNANSGLTFLGNPFISLKGTHYKVKDEKMMEKLTAFGINSSQVTTVKPSVHKPSKFARDGVVINSILIALLVISLSIGLPLGYVYLKKQLLTKKQIDSAPSN